MVDLLEELEEMGEFDEENFIYLDEHGKAELKHELIFKWNGFPTKKIHITCRASDTISYIKTLLYVAMEKYSIFLGLKNFRINNLATSKEDLPATGSIGNYIRPDNYFTFDIDSQDIWLEFQIDFRDLASVIFFELKVPKDATIYSLKLFVVEILNNLLIVQNFVVRYEVENIKLYRIKMTHEMILASNLKKSVLTQLTKTQKTKDTSDEQTIKEVFNYVNRYVLCVPSENRIQITDKKRSSLVIKDMRGPAVVEVLENVKTSFQVRFPRSEAMIQRKPHRSASGNIKRKNSVEAQKHEVCNCIII